MSAPLPFLNWSLKKAIDSQPDSFARAQLRIMTAIIVFSLVKAGIVIGFGAAAGQQLQVVRAVAAFVIYSAVLKVLLSRPGYMKPLAHLMVSLGIFFVWSNIFIYAHKVNLVTIQFVFMIVLSSFYTISSFGAIIYSIISMAPVILFMAAKGNIDMSFSGSGQELVSPGYELIVVFNFISIIASHYLFYQAFNENLAEKEALNRDLQKAVAEARKMAESRTSFLSTMSHELRTPLNSVIGMAELLTNDKPELRQLENLGVLQYAAMDLLSLINNVLDFNKIDSDKVVLEQVPFLLSEFMENISRGLKIKANGKRLEFVLDVDERLANVIVVSDPTRLSQLIYNLAGNALKFTEKGSIVVKLECAARSVGQVQVAFSVTDTGVGIHPDRHATIFDVFAQAETDTTRRYGGTGLGLSIVKQLATLFHSDISLESSVNIGSRFSFTIPFVEAKEGTRLEKQDRKDTADISGLRILVAEDNNFNRLIIRKQFDMLNLEPDIVENGERAYEACMTGDYDAIFIDLHMPVMDGYETTKLIRAIDDDARSNVYIVAFTASVTEQERILKSGFDDYLYKPVNMNDLREKLSRIVESDTRRERMSLS